MKRGKYMDTLPKRSLRSFSGFLILLLIYIVLGVTAVLFYPKGFNPAANTLAQLGDPKLNPTGAMFYNIGVFIICSATLFITGALLITPKQWLASRGATKKTVFYLTINFMALFSIFLMLSTLVPSSSNYALNSFLTLLFFVFLELFVASSAYGIRRLKDHVSWVPTFGFAMATLNFLLVLASAASGLTIFSWLISITTWAYMVVFIYEFSATKV